MADFENVLTSQDEAVLNANEAAVMTGYSRERLCLGLCPTCLPTPASSHAGATSPLLEVLLYLSDAFGCNDGTESY
jgi:hypothetical protein